jgi:hypothetical protein
MPPQDTGKYRTNGKDQYYTKDSVAKQCVDTLLAVCPEVDTGYLWIEPAAGNGAFLKQRAGSIGIDIDPKATVIQKADFLTWTPPVGQCLLFGNPPFGRQGSLVKAFIQRGTTYADLIAFILPRSFVKPSMSRVFPPLFHCLFSEELPANSFAVNDQTHNVPCVFQIWKKRDTERAVEPVAQPVGFSYVKATETHDLVFRRVGVNAGRCYRFAAGQSYSPQSHYFLKLAATTDQDPDTVASRLCAHTFPNNTTGPRSIAKPELNATLNAILSENQVIE